MTSANELLSVVRTSGVEIWAEGGKLRLRGPKDSLPANLMQSLTARKAEILQLLELDATQQELPLSQAQLAVWQAYRAAPQSPAYNVNAVIELQPDYRHAVLEQAFEHAVARHPGLRCIFAEGGNGSAIQRVQPARHFSIDRQHAPDAPGEHAAAIAEVIDRPFRLLEESPLRVVVLDTPSGRHDLIIVVHHVASDYWGSGILIEEVIRAYGALLNSAEPQFQTPESSLRESIEREAARAGDPKYPAALERGSAIVADDALALDLPTDFPRPKRRRMAGANLSVALDPGLTEQVRATARAHDVTAYTVMLTAFATLLARAARQDRFRIGIPVAGRMHAGEHALVGNFVNLVPLVAETDPGLDVVGNLQRMQRTVLAAIDAQVVPFMDLVQHGGHLRSSSRGAFFDVVFNWNKFTSPPANAELVRNYVRGSSTGVSGATHDIALSIVEHEAHFACLWNYDTDLYDADSIGSMAHLYAQFLRQLVSDPRRSLSLVPILPESEVAAALATMRAPDSIPAGVLPIRAFEAQAAARPRAIAVRDEAGELTYAELNRRANALAYHLLARGVGPEQVVALCMERGVRFAVAMLGIAKTGAAYLPIDANEPAARIAALCAGAGVTTLVSTTSCANLPHGHDLDVVFVDFFKTPAVQVEADPRIELHPDNLAYVIFTSGSTGTPKGVMVTQRGLASLIDWHRVAFATGPGCIGTQMAKVGFDACVLEMWPVLCAGGALCVVPAQVLENPARIPAYLAAQQVTWSFITTALYESIAADAWVACPPSARIAVGGDTLHAYRDAAVGRLDNFYGPTEITVLATAGAVGASGSSSLPGIGKPIPGVDVLTLDAEDRPVPIGWIGEMHLAGPGLARGYIDDPRRTAEAFTPHPFPRTPGERVYRSGDLGRYRASDGELAFCGRADRQVKLRGYRIELGEIEQCLRLQPQVRDVRTIVVGREEHRRLVAFCTGDLTADVARDWLRARLPAYMVPAQIQVLDHLPTNANGKIDLGALAARVQTERRARVAAATQTEEQLLAVWREVLAGDELDVVDEFFESGGHSLLAAKLAEKIRGVNGMEASIVDVLENPTVRELAAVLDSRPRARAAVAQPIVAAADARFDPFPLTDVQHAYWVGRSGGFELGNVATHIYTETDSASFDAELSGKVWNQLIERHDMLRAVFSADGQQRVLPQVPPYRMQVEDLSALDEPERHRRLMETRARMSHQVFDPQQWPLFEFRLSILGAGRVRLHGSFDALIADAHSFALLGREYAQIVAGKGDSLAPLGITFRDYVLAERRLRSGDAYIKARDYWLARVDEFPAEPQLPLALDPSRIEQPRFSRLRTRLEAPAWSVLKEKARRLHVTPSVLLLGAYAQVLSKWSSSSRFVLNLTLFNRVPLHPDIANVVGDFTSLTAFEVGPGGGTFAERLARHQAQLWRDLAHRAFSAVELLRELRRRRGNEPVRMPVVFTSVLPLEAGDDGPTGGAAAADYSITQTPQVWLDHVVQELDGALLVHWDFVEELFPAALMPTMFAAFESLLRDLVSDDASWHAIEPVALPSTQRAARNTFNETRYPQPPALRIFDGFLASARRDPSAVALVSQARTLTYGELRDSAYGIAAQLLAAGVRRGARVAVMMHKGWEQVAAAIGVSLTGAAYLPIDASLPEARRLQLIAAAGVRVALIQPQDPMAHARHTDLQMLPVDAGVRGESFALPEVGERDLAYVIFTSGSTGTPKGVMIDHRGAVNTILDINRRFDLTATDRLLALSSLSFDLSVWDVFGALAVGAAVVIPAEDEVANPQRWSRYLRAQSVTVINAVPAFLQMLVDYLETQSSRDVGPLRLVMMSGDWIPVTLPARLRALAPACHIESLGGATEVSIWSISHTIVAADAQRRSIPYGRPLLNQRLHVMHDDLSECPDWVPGMLYIAGDGLALGYWGDARKTAQSFVPDPAAVGGRMYRTGDFGRYLPEGVLEFLGRRDDQVKVQGHRIELAEIEAHLLTHPGVREAAVQPQGSGAARALYAYVVTADGFRKSAGAATRGALDYLPASVGQGATQPVIADPLERLQFKFSQRGLRRFGDATVVSLSDLPAVLKVGGGVPATDAAPRHDLRALSALLTAFRGWKQDGPLPKYFYPSAGSLYPVQVYLRVAVSSVLGLEGGTYYFHPLENALYRTGDAPAEVGAIELHLIADMEAITPLYGTLAAGFCEVEAGGMGALLESGAHMSGLSWQDLRADRAALAQSCHLAPAHRLLKSFACPARAAPQAAVAPRDAMPFELPLLARQSFREFHGGTASRQQIERMLQGCTAASWLLVKADAVADLAAGLYRIVDDGRRLEMIADGALAMEPVFVGDNAPVFAAAAFAVLFAADSALEAGENAGRMQILAAGGGLGLCAIGYVDQVALEAAVPVLAGVRINHALLGGSVSTEQRSRWISIEKPDLGRTLARELEAHLKSRLPEYMVPRGFIALDRLPLSTNGKVDRKALPLPAEDTTRRFQAPQGDLEQSIAAVWCEVLAVERVSREESFFALGGNSMLLIQMYQRLRGILPVEIAVTDLFAHVTIAALAAHVMSRVTAPAASESTAALQERAARRHSGLARRREGLAQTGTTQ